MKTIGVWPESQLHKCRRMAPLKRDITEESTQNEDHHHPPDKRSKQQDFGLGAFTLNPLDEPSPLGLRLRKTPSLLDMIQMRLSQGNSSNANTELKATAANDKLKASNFPASLLKIGTWEYASRHEGDLVAKCYFAKHKLVWEVLDGGLKNKIEFQWSDIMGLKASYPEDGPGTLDVVLSRQPLFYRETNPQPRKHTLWQASSDFTGGQASLHRRHSLQIPQGFLGKHFEKLTQCDPRLNFLSQQTEEVTGSPYFAPRASVFDKPSRKGLATFDLHGRASLLGGLSSSSRGELHDPDGRAATLLQEAPSPSSVIDTSTIEEIRRTGINGMKGIGQWDQMKVRGLCSSMPMSELVNHIENRVIEHKSPSKHPQIHDEQKSFKDLQDVGRCLLKDSWYGSSASVKKSVMSKANSLGHLLQKDPTKLQFSRGVTDDRNGKLKVQKSINESKPPSGPLDGIKSAKDYSTFKDGASEGNKGPGMLMKDSDEELLLNLPRIASLPKIFFKL